MDGQGGMPMIESAYAVEYGGDISSGGARYALQKRMNRVAVLSHASRFAKGQAIRGGIPVILPWFGAREGAAAHGFARTAHGIEGD